ncbi:phosphoglycerate kinase [Hasllibacter halocynthiae]|uniref:Phosphoglycerate kinase n=1 Tax=Hasllibacter halocynthiae TaxID=595589 RepID=A0A2T0X7H3_9RHOB|nr:phosphoglycerate kinase [Hasllibacter halocynthiae]PRY94901.1 phosphoglycerate kinase [Hasllibacter halocynthiae]
MAWKTLDDLEIDGKRVLVRVDLNVPMKDGAVTDATRIERIVPTVKDIQARGGMPVLLAHLGRPKGEVRPELSLRQIVPALEDALGQKVAFADGDYSAAAGSMKPGDVLLLENLRFDPGEEQDDEGFARRLSAIGDVYVNDAFSAAHRAHSSTHALARMLPAAAGRLMEAELNALESVLGRAKRPVLAIVGGAKVSTKLAVLRNLIDRVDSIVIGGGMANTFLAAQGIDIGKSLAEHDMADTAREIVRKAEEKGCTLLLPRDVVVAWKFEADAENDVVMAENVPADAMILDAGPDSVFHIGQAIEDASTVIWNGPLGAFELEPFDAGTLAVAEHVAHRTRDGELISVAGGGDTVAALAKAGVTDDLTYVSTAGGAFLEWMEGKALPGIAALAD